MKNFILAAALITSITSASAANCLETYERVAQNMSSRNDKLKFASIAGAGVVFVATAGLGTPLILGTVGYGLITKGESQFNGLSDSLQAAHDNDLDNYSFGKFRKFVNKGLKKLNLKDVSSIELASILNQASQSQAICPSVINQSGLTNRIAFNKKALRNYVINEIQNPGSVQSINIQE